MSTWNQKAVATAPAAKSNMPNRNQFRQPALADRTIGRGSIVATRRGGAKALSSGFKVGPRKYRSEQ
jgi:hypothetical protein